MGMGGINKAAFLAMYASGFPMNVIHGSATVIFLAVLGEPMLAKLERIRKKYGMTGAVGFQYGLRRKQLLYV